MNNIKIAILMDMPLYPYRIYAYNELVRRGYELLVVSIANTNTQYDIPLLFEHRIVTPKWIGPFVKLNNFKAKNYKNFDVIIVDPNLRMLDYYYFYNKKYWNKLIGWGHHKGCTSGNKCAELFRFRFFRKFRALVFYDYETKDEYIDKGFNPLTLYVANNTQYVDLTLVKLDSIRDSFVYVGRIQDRKAIDVALQAFAVTKKLPAMQNVKFKVVGGGDATHLKMLCEKLGIIDDVIFTGPIHDQSELANIFNAAYGYVSPGHVGLGVLHSLAFGVPVITCIGRKHSLEIVNCNDNNSCLVDFNINSIAEAMTTLCLSKERFSQMSESAHAYYKEYCTIDIMVNGIDDAIKYINGLNKSNNDKF